MGRLLSVLCLTLTVACTGWARHSPILETAELVDTQQTIFSSGGTLELQGSYGDVKIIGWDQPQIEVRVTKSTQRRYAPLDKERALDELDKIVVSAEPVKANHLVVKTEFPANGVFGPPSRAKTKVNLQYVIRVPRTTRIIVRHDAGEVRVHDVTANMDVAARSGRIRLDLPEDQDFVIDAQAREGDITSEWCSNKRNSWRTAHRVTLRLGVGDICITKSHEDDTDEDDSSNG